MLREEEPRAGRKGSVGEGRERKKRRKVCAVEGRDEGEWQEGGKEGRGRGGNEGEKGECFEG